MNWRTVVMLGVFTGMLLAMPTLADDNRFVRETGAATGTPAAQSTAIGTAPVARGCGADTQSPVLDGGAFSNYDTMFVHGVNAWHKGNDYDIYDIVYNGWGTDFWLYGMTSTYPPDAVIFCPIPSYQLKTGGSSLW